MAYKNKKPILLVSFWQGNKDFRLPIGIKTLQSILQKENFNVKVLLINKINLNREDCNAITKWIISQNPLYTGVSFWSICFKSAIFLTKILKKRHISPIIFGGIHPTIDPETSLNYADAVCVGEGDEAIKEISARLNIRNFDLSNIPNIWIKKDKKIIKPTQKIISDLNKLPFIDWDLNNFIFEDNKKRIIKFNHLEKQKYPIMISRGCVYNCSYCINHVLKKKYGLNNTFRRRSINNIINELKDAKEKRGIGYVYFWDDMFMDKKWIKSFCKEYKRKIGLPFFCYFHPNNVDNESIAHLKKAGLKNIIIGIQTGSDKIARFYNRLFSKKSVINASKIINKYKIDVLYDIIIDSPLESKKSINDTVLLIKKLKPPFKIGVCPMIFFKSYDLSNLLLRKKLISNKDIEHSSQKSLNDNWLNQWQFKQLAEGIKNKIENVHVKENLIEVAEKR